MAEVRPGAEPIAVVMQLDADDPAALTSLVARYVVLARGSDGCRNIDLFASATVPGRLVIVQKWASAAHQQAHFDSGEMVRFAEEAVPLLAAPPQIDLLDPISAHDLA